MGNFSGTRNRYELGWEGVHTHTHTRARMALCTRRGAGKQRGVLCSRSCLDEWTIWRLVGSPETGVGGCLASAATEAAVVSKPSKREQIEVENISSI